MSGMTGTAGGAGELPYGLYVNATTVSTMTDYPDVTASLREVTGGTELEIEGTVTNAAGTQGYLRIQLGSNPVPGTHPCSESVFVTTLQLCCPPVYDSRNEPIDPDCSVTLREVGSAPGTDVAGTFSAVTHDENGGRMFLRDGRFRIRL